MKSLWSILDNALQTRRGISLWRVGFLAAGDGKFFARLQGGRSCTLRVAQNVVQHLSDHLADRSRVAHRHFAACITSGD